MQQDDSTIPTQKEGAKTDVVSSEKFETAEEAKSFFQECKQRLLNINNWGIIAGVASADFKLTDKQGNEVQRGVANIGDCFKIDIPGPGTATGEGFDWVQIESIDEESLEDREEIAIRVRPASNPKNTKTDVAHFFTDEATSSFIVERRGTEVSAGVHGRNEKPNTKADAILDKTRNVMIASGAAAGFSEVQWKKLVNGLLGK